MEITSFSRKLISMLHYDMPKNSLPMIIFISFFIFVDINIFIALHMEPVNLEKTLLTVIEAFMITILFCQCIKRNLNNNQEFIILLELIESDFAVSRNELTGTADELWLKTHKYYQKKREDMRAMYKKLAAVFIVMGVLFCNRNVLNYISELITGSENESDWPTPYLIYCPPKLKSFAFFICTYFLQSSVMLTLTAETFVIVNLVCLSTEKVLADFETLFILLEHLANVFIDLEIYDDYSSNNISQANQHQNNSNYYHTTKTASLRRGMARIVRCHQTLNRNFKVCLDCSGSMISLLNFVIMLYSCVSAYLMLTTNDFKKRINFGSTFTMVSLAIFFVYHNGQRIFNQNEILRRTLAELPWTDKPQWFKQTLLMMFTRANVDMEMRPYRIYTLNYMSFKELMKTAFSIGNILYTKKLKGQALH